MAASVAIWAQGTYRLCRSLSRYAKQEAEKASLMARESQARSFHWSALDLYKPTLPASQPLDHLSVLQMQAVTITQYRKTFEAVPSDTAVTITQSSRTRGFEAPRPWPLLAKTRAPDGQFRAEGGQSQNHCSPKPRPWPLLAQSRASDGQFRAPVTQGLSPGQRLFSRHPSGARLFSRHPSGARLFSRQRLFSSSSTKPLESDSCGGGRQ